MLRVKEQTENYSLDVQEWKSDRFPIVVAVFASHLVVLVPLFFDEGAVLDAQRIPHKVFLQIPQFRMHIKQGSPHLLCYNFRSTKSNDPIEAMTAVCLCIGL